MEEINPCEDIKGYMNDVKGIAIPFQKKHYEITFHGHSTAVLWFETGK